MLQEREITPVGSTITKKINVRVIAATNAPLEDLIAEKLFRTDLFFRLNVLRINLPPLRERTEDIPHLVAAFLADENKKAGTDKIILESATECLRKYSWPGNVRELQNAISFLANATPGKILDMTLLPPEFQGTNTREGRLSSKKLKDYDSLKFRSLLDEKQLLQEALKTSSNPTAAARKLGMKRSTFRDKLKKYGILFDKIKSNSLHPTKEDK